MEGDFDVVGLKRGGGVERDSGSESKGRRRGEVFLGSSVMPCAGTWARRLEGVHTALTTAPRTSLLSFSTPIRASSEASSGSCKVFGSALGR